MCFLHFVRFSFVTVAEGFLRLREFYNTGISTYVWIVSNRKPAHRQGKLQLIDGSSFWQKMRKSLGSKRKALSPAHIEAITRLFGNCEAATRDGAPISRLFKNEDFGYHTITVEVPPTFRQSS